MFTLLGLTQFVFTSAHYNSEWESPAHQGMSVVCALENWWISGKIKNFEQILESPIQIFLFKFAHIYRPQVHSHCKLSRLSLLWGAINTEWSYECAAQTFLLSTIALQEELSPYCSISRSLPLPLLPLPLYDPTPGLPVATTTLNPTTPDLKVCLEMHIWIGMDISRVLIIGIIYACSTHTLLAIISKIFFETIFSP